MDKAVVMKTNCEIGVLSKQDDIPRQGQATKDCAKAYTLGDDGGAAVLIEASQINSHQILSNPTVVYST